MVTTGLSVRTGLLLGYEAKVGALVSRVRMISKSQTYSHVGGFAEGWLADVCSIGF